MVAMSCSWPGAIEALKISKQRTLSFACTKAFGSSPSRDRLREELLHVLVDALEHLVEVPRVLGDDVVDDVLGGIGHGIARAMLDQLPDDLFDEPLLLGVEVTVDVPERHEVKNYRVHLVLGALRVRAERDHVQHDTRSKASPHQSERAQSGWLDEHVPFGPLPLSPPRTQCPAWHWYQRSSNFDSTQVLAGSISSSVPE